MVARAEEGREHDEVRRRSQARVCAVTLLGLRVAGVEIVIVMRLRSALVVSLATTVPLARRPLLARVPL